jgi:hypothetical protein
VIATTSACFDAARRWYVMSTLIEPIKADFGLSDFSIAFLTGTAPACFYVTAGLPLAYLANRRSLVALAAWSVMTACCLVGRTPYICPGRVCLLGPVVRGMYK